MFAHKIKLLAQSAAIAACSILTILFLLSSAVEADSKYFWALKPTASASSSTKAYLFFCDNNSPYINWTKSDDWTDFLSIYNINSKKVIFNPACPCTISGSITTSANWNIKIFDSENNLIRQYTGTGISFYQVFDGKDASGNLLSDGIYTYKINAAANGANALEVSGTVEIDTRIDDVIISNISPGQTLSGNVDIKCIAADKNIWRGILYCQSEDDMLHNRLNYIGEFIGPGLPDSNGQPQLLFSWNTANFPNGNYKLLLNVSDRANNYSSAETLVILSNTEIYGVSTDPIEGVFNPSMEQFLIYGHTTTNANWNIKIFDSANNLKRQYTGTGTSFYEYFDGQDSAGNLLSSGVYTYKINAEVNGKNAQEVSGKIEIDTSITLYNIYCTHPLFNPSNFGCTLRVDITTIANWNIKIFDSANNLKRQYTGTGKSFTQAFDGKDTSGNLLSDGVYTYKINASANGANALEVPGTVEIDTKIDTATISNISPGQTLSGTVDIKGIAADRNFDSSDYGGYKKLYCKAANSTNWISINCSQKPVLPDSNGQPQVLGTWDTASLTNGNYTLKLEVVDKAYNIKNVEVPVVLSNIWPDISGLAILPNPFSPDESGTWLDISTTPWKVYNQPAPGLILDDIAAISFTASQSGVFDVKVVDASSQTVKQINLGILTPDQNNKINLSWDGTDKFGIPVKNGQYRLIANNKETIITVDKMVFIDYVQVTPNPFSFGNTTTLSYNISEDAYVTIEIFDQNNTLVKKLLNNQLLTYGAQSQIWDGKNDQGTLAPLGKYTIKISAKAKTGNNSGQPAYANVCLSSLSNISVSKDKLNAYLGETVSINYSVSVQAKLNFKVYNSSNTLVKTIASNVLRSSGTYFQTWDGKDSAGNIVPDGPYYFMIEDTISGSTNLVYDPRNTGGQDISKNISLIATDFNTYNNQFCVITYNLPKASKINLKVRYARYEGPALKVIKYQEPTPSGAGTVLWDGCAEDGYPITYAHYTFAIWAYTLDENSVIVTGGTPEIITADVTPRFFNPLNNNPYKISTSTKSANITFNLSINCNVKADIYNEDGVLVCTLLNNTAAVQGANSVTWDGKSSDGKIVEPGLYTIRIQANKNGIYSNFINLNCEVYY